MVLTGHPFRQKAHWAGRFRTSGRNYFCRRPVVTVQEGPHRSEQGDPTHDDSGRHTPGLTTTVTHRNGLFRLGVILGRIARHAETRRVEIGGFRTLARAWAGFRD
jgi:hypothetical protein